MTVLRDGYFDGAYRRPGDVIEVEEAWIESLELARFAEGESWPANRSTSPREPITPKTASPMPREKPTP
jgi:hypothetical protein